MGLLWIVHEARVGVYSFVSQTKNGVLSFLQPHWTEVAVEERPMAQRIKRLPAMQETWVQSLGWEDPLEKEMATHSSTLAQKIPCMGSPVGYSPWGRKESDTTE